MGRSESQRFEESTIVDAITQAKGLISLAARALGCCPNTIRRRAKTSKAIRDAITHNREYFIDRAQLKLMDAVEDREPWAIALTLKTLGKSLGYSEKEQVDIGSMPPGLSKADQVEWIVSKIEILEQHLKNLNEARSD